MVAVGVDYGWVVFCVVLSGWLGFELIGKIPSRMHTPLMSGTNAISGITLVGALAELPYVTDVLMTALCYAAIFFAVINVVGGYCVTDRMLKMFKK